MTTRFRSILLVIILLVLTDWITKLVVLLQYKDLQILTHPTLYTHSWGRFSFSLTPVFNEGAAFGLFSNYKYFLFLLRIFIILGILAYLLFKKQSTSSLTRGALVLLCSGAIGNVGDIVFYGHVVDFISFNYKQWAFPTFNLADIFISSGTLLLLYKFYFPTKQIEKKR
ncbi:Lipoprotein signal peptidase,lipoprotein signal peptidase,signal peptidase II,Signal peptidase (SPase) II [Chlamydia serpentis]|uniref:Lipoprotein signal peptidase n=1 Tax=Chlamydia serpentis TaxID=1967782 RepID=A0A2R8FB60_9CHLA|nr:signal peptidase II [Chlamydia serpentis]SPN73654.1 Lipoprotein signal peptidase,lipoprotein signal peptidase,signal peptidase II,Signal peptidase (SPase) II [Chlamydia serpentis]